MTHPFFCLHNHGFIRAAVATPQLKVAEPAFNAAKIIEMSQQADQQAASVVLFPELGLSAYAIDDLLQQDVLLLAVERGLEEIIKASAHLKPIIIVGAPLRYHGRLYNCAVAIFRG
ncbi:MAG: nitrilase-related carbon-nitrogen hydrolase, partial [Methylocystis sp.]